MTKPDEHERDLTRIGVLCRTIIEESKSEANQLLAAQLLFNLIREDRSINEWRSRRVHG